MIFEIQWHNHGIHKSINRDSLRLLEILLKKNPPNSKPKPHTVFSHLYLHGHLAAVLHPRQMNLADGRCSEGSLLKRLQLVSPVWAQVAVQGFLQAVHKHTRITVTAVTFDISWGHDLPSFVWLAWSRRSVARGQRSWPAGGWWKRHLTTKRRRLCSETKENHFAKTLFRPFFKRNLIKKKKKCLPVDLFNNTKDY